MYQLRIFESDNAPLGLLRFTTRDDMYDVVTFLLENNENNKWEFELLNKQGRQIWLLWIYWRLENLRTQKEFFLNWRLINRSIRFLRICIK